MFIVFENLIIPKKSILGVEVLPDNNTSKVYTITVTVSGFLGIPRSIKKQYDSYKDCILIYDHLKRTLQNG